MNVIVRKPTPEEAKTAKSWPIREKEVSTFPGVTRTRNLPES